MQAVRAISTPSVKHLGTEWGNILVHAQARLGSPTRQTHSTHLHAFPNMGPINPISAQKGPCAENDVTLPFRFRYASVPLPLRVLFMSEILAPGRPPPNRRKFLHGPWTSYATRMR